MSVYIISNDVNHKQGRYKFGKHGGTQRELINRYKTPLVNPIIYFYFPCSDNSIVEKAILAKLDIYRVRDDNGRLTEWINYPLINILQVIIPLTMSTQDYQSERISSRGGNPGEEGRRCIRHGNKIGHGCCNVVTAAKSNMRIVKMVEVTKKPHTKVYIPSLTTISHFFTEKDVMDGNISFTDVKVPPAAHKYYKFDDTGKPTELLPVRRIRFVEMDIYSIWLYAGDDSRDHLELVKLNDLSTLEYKVENVKDVIDYENIFGNTAREIDMCIRDKSGIDAKVSFHKGYIKLNNRDITTHFMDEIWSHVRRYLVSNGKKMLIFEQSKDSRFKITEVAPPDNSVFVRFEFFLEEGWDRDDYYCLQFDNVRDAPIEHEWN